MASLLSGAALAWYAAVGGVLRDSALYLAGTVSELPPDRAPGHTPLFIILYWLVFSLTILIALYMAMIDIRYIRVQYLTEKREIFRRTLGDSDFRKTLFGDEDDKGKPESRG